MRKKFRNDVSILIWRCTCPTTIMNQNELSEKRETSHQSDGWFIYQQNYYLIFNKTALAKITNNSMLSISRKDTKIEFQVDSRKREKEKEQQQTPSEYSPFQNEEENFRWERFMVFFQRWFFPVVTSLSFSSSSSCSSALANVTFILINTNGPTMYEAITPNWQNFNYVNSNISVNMPTVAESSIINKGWSWHPTEY